MSEADALVERLSDPNPFGWRRRAKRVEKWDYADPGECVWTMASGEQIKFKDMTIEHRTNCLSLLIRRHGERARDTPTGRALVKVGVLP